jgi:FkbM family methyltransferase
MQPHEVYNAILDWHHRGHIPKGHVKFLTEYCQDKKFNVIYDIGSSVLHWHREIKNIYPNSTVYCFDGAPNVEPLYKANKIDGWCIGLLGDQDKEVECQLHTGLNLVNFYEENIELSKVPASHFRKTTLQMRKLSTAIKEKNFELPDLIKMDIQGSELDVIKGSVEVIQHSKAVILELPTLEWNLGAPHKTETIEFMESIGFKNCGEFFRNPTGADGDFLFENLNT